MAWTRRASSGCAASCGPWPARAGRCWCPATADRHAQLAAILERERSRGGIPPDVEHAADALLGPLYYRALITGHPADPGWARELVHTLLR